MPLWKICVPSANDTRLILSDEDLGSISNASSLMAALAESTDGQTVLAQLDGFIEKYGYLSPVGTDIAVATLARKPWPCERTAGPVLCCIHPPNKSKTEQSSGGSSKTATVQRRLDLKGRINTLYNRLLAELRWCFLAIESQWLQSGLLQAQGDVFFSHFG